MENVMKKILISTALILSLSACGNADSLPTECNDLLKTMEELIALKEQNNMTDDKEDMDITKAKAELIEQVKKDAKATTAECKQANEVLIPMVQMIKALPKK